MFTQIDNLPAGVVGVVASGRVTVDDRQRILEPVIEDTVETAGRVRLLYVAGPDFAGYDRGGLYDDAVFGTRHFNHFDRIAFVGNDGPYHARGAGAERSHAGTAARLRAQRIRSGAGVAGGQRGLTALAPAEGRISSPPSDRASCGFSSSAPRKLPAQADTSFFISPVEHVAPARHAVLARHGKRTGDGVARYCRDRKG